MRAKPPVKFNESQTARVTLFRRVREKANVPINLFTDSPGPRNLIHSSKVSRDSGRRGKDGARYARARDARDKE